MPIPPGGPGPLDLVDFFSAFAVASLSAIAVQKCVVGSAGGDNTVTGLSMNYNYQTLATGVVVVGATLWSLMHGRGDKPKVAELNVPGETIAEYARGRYWVSYWLW